MNVLLIYEEIPESTTIVDLSPSDLEAAQVTIDDLKSIAGMVVNSDNLTDTQHEIMNKIIDALSTGKYQARGAWADRYVNHLSPIELNGSRLVIWCGFAL